MAAVKLVKIPLRAEHHNLSKNYCNATSDIFLESLQHELVPDTLYFDVTSFLKIFCDKM
jgi:hypothetical protein